MVMPSAYQRRRRARRPPRSLIWTPAASKRIMLLGLYITAGGVSTVITVKGLGGANIVVETDFTAGDLFREISVPDDNCPPYVDQVLTAARSIRSRARAGDHDQAATACGVEF